jgi:transcriptional regulator with XRE-family HTH domain
MTGNEFKERRRALGKTQLELAADMEVHTRTIWTWEKGIMPVPRLAALRLIQLWENSGNVFGGHRASTDASKVDGGKRRRAKRNVG